MHASDLCGQWFDDVRNIKVVAKNTTNPHDAPPAQSALPQLHVEFTGSKFFDHNQMQVSNVSHDCASRNVSFVVAYPSGTAEWALVSSGSQLTGTATNDRQYSAAIELERQPNTRETHRPILHDLVNDLERVSLDEQVKERTGVGAAFPKELLTRHERIFARSNQMAHIKSRQRACLLQSPQCFTSIMIGSSSI